MTTRKEISGWFDIGVAKGATHMLVVCDTYDWEDYPVYVAKHEDVHSVAARNSGPNMTKLMEVYNLAMDKERQLVQHRAFNY